MIEKRVLLPDRVRRPPAEGWSWIDRRFLRDHASRLSHEAILLYFFLVAVSDKHGLSFYGDATIAVRLRMQEEAVVRAREELLAEPMVARIEPTLCSDCHACVESCPFGAIEEVEWRDVMTRQTRNVARVIESLCHGCGNCTVVCRAGAPNLAGFSHQQVYAQVEMV